MFKKAVVIVFPILFFGNTINAFAQNKEIISTIDSSYCIAHDTVVHVTAEKNAMFQDGDLKTFRTYVSKNLIYPKEAFFNNDMQGKVYVKFIVDWDGQVKDVSVFKSSGFEALDKEAVRVIKSSPRWTSAKNNNICVPQQFILPVGFKNLGIIINNLNYP